MKQYTTHESKVDVQVVSQRRDRSVNWTIPCFAHFHYIYLKFS